MKRTRYSEEQIIGTFPMQAQAETGLGGGHGNGMGLSERHEEPHLLIGDMTARHERFPKRKTVLYRDRSRPPDPPVPGETQVGGSPVGRKNYLFVGTQTGRRAAAIAYTLIETAKLNGVDPQGWLADALARIPD